MGSKFAPNRATYIRADSMSGKRHLLHAGYSGDGLLDRNPDNAFIDQRGSGFR